MKVTTKMSDLDTAKDRIIELESKVGVALETIKHQRETIDRLGQQLSLALQDIEKLVEENKEYYEIAKKRLAENLEL